MPDGCGDYLLGRLQNHPLTRDIPVFVLTGPPPFVLRYKMNPQISQITQILPFESCRLQCLSAASVQSAVPAFSSAKPLELGALLDGMRQYVPMPERPNPAHTERCVLTPGR